MTTDRHDPNLRKTHESGPLKGQQFDYLVLSEEERGKGFLRPVRRKCLHIGCRPKGATRPLTAEEHERYDQFGYVCFEPYGPEYGSATGRFWTEKQLKSGCGTVTTMGQAIAETYARDFRFYGATMCVHCQAHFPVGVDGEFVWLDEHGNVTDERVGT